MSAHAATSSKITMDTKYLKLFVRLIKENQTRTSITKQIDATTMSAAGEYFENVIVFSTAFSICIHLFHLL